MTEVERLVGVRRRVLDHDERTVLSNWLLAELRVSVDGVQESYPSGRSDRKVEETLNHVEVCDNVSAVFLQVVTNLECSSLRSLL